MSYLRLMSPYREPSGWRSRCCSSWWAASRAGPLDTQAALVAAFAANRLASSNAFDEDIPGWAGRRVRPHPC